MRSDLEIANEIELKPIKEIAEYLELHEDQFVPYGKYLAKIPVSVLDDHKENEDGKVILVTAMTPTSMGEGKTTTTIGLAQALAKIGKKSLIAIREPSLGPCMGVKGGAAGGGYSQVLPMEDINLHLTGDIHAISITHNLLSAVIDNHIHQKNEPEINARDVNWRRVIDMNDRTLRHIIVGLQGKGSNGVMREDGFDITASSEIMAILCLSNSLNELKEKIGNIIVGYSHLKKPIFARDIQIEGAMTSLLKHAINPNLAQSIEGVPAFIHGGPFANIAHGCNSIIATKMAMKLGDYIVTEAGFGADLGAEKFFNIKCRMGDIKPRAAVLVVTTRAYELHGIENIKKHGENLLQFNIPFVISVNKFLGDSDGQLNEIVNACRDNGFNAVITDFRETGGEGGLELAHEIDRIAENDNNFDQLYDLKVSIKEKIETVANKIYGATGIQYSQEATNKIKQLENLGFKEYPICIAKTQSSFSDNPKLTGRPESFTITVSDAKVSAGAGFIVIYTGKIMTMPGLPKNPSALQIDINDQGNISGLF